MNALASKQPAFVAALVGAWRALRVRNAVVNTALDSRHLRTLALAHRARQQLATSGDWAYRTTPRVAHRLHEGDAVFLDTLAVYAALDVAVPGHLMPNQFSPLTKLLKRFERDVYSQAEAVSQLAPAQHVLLGPLLEGWRSMGLYTYHVQIEDLFIHDAAAYRNHAIRTVDSCVKAGLLPTTDAQSFVTATVRELRQLENAKAFDSAYIERAYSLIAEMSRSEFYAEALVERLRRIAAHVKRAQQGSPAV